MGLYNRAKFHQLMIHKEVKEELDGISKDIIQIYNIKPKRNVTYSRVIQCLMVMPAESIRSKASGAQEVVQSIMFNGSSVPPVVVVEHAG